jgi:hypothetical protein
MDHLYFSKCIFLKIIYVYFYIDFFSRKFRRRKNRISPGTGKGYCLVLRWRLNWRLRVGSARKRRRWLVARGGDEEPAAAEGPGWWRGSVAGAPWTMAGSCSQCSDMRECL